MNAKNLAALRYEQFSRFAEDLYPGRYTPAFCRILAEQELEINALRRAKNTIIVAHNYLYPEFHEIADKVGDSLGLSWYVRDQKAGRVDFQSVYFMGETAKIITGGATQVFVSDLPQTLGCSLVFGTDHEWLERWKKSYPSGILVTYINSDAYTKSISDFISTSRNTDAIIAYALKTYPDRRILVLPDKYLGLVMKERALERLRLEGITANSDLVEVYTHHKDDWHACCYVHEQIGQDAAEQMLEEYPSAELMIHPECGCASSCLYKLQAGIIPRARAYFLSTEGMVEHAKRSPSRQYIVATEKGMIYRLRKELPEKEFIPVSQQAECRYMKANTLEKLLASLHHNRFEIVFCKDCCDPKNPYQDDSVIHVPQTVAEKARVGIERMLTIQ